MPQPPAAPPKAPAVDTKAAPAKDVKPATNVAPAATPAEQTTEVKVNGKLVKLTNAQLIAAAQKGLFADQKLSALDTLQKTSTALISKLKTPEGIMEVLRDPALGTSPKDVFKKLMASDVIDDELKEEMSAWVYRNVVQPAKLTPQELEREKKLNDYERLKKADEERKQKDLNAQQQAQLQQIYTAVRSEVTKQINADANFPKVEGAIRAVIDKVRVMNKNGVQITGASITKAIELVKKDNLLHQQALFDEVKDNPEKLIERIGEERALMISRALIARIKARQANKQKEEKPQPQQRERVQDRINKRFGTDDHGMQVMEF